MAIRALHAFNRTFVRVTLAAAAIILWACSGDGPSAPQLGSLQITISGLPGGASASVTVTGPAGFSRSLTSSTTLNQLAAGQYTVTAADVTLDGSTYTGAPSSQTYTVVAGGAMNSPTVTYVIATGTLSVTMTGLPQSSSASIVVSGPDNYTRTLDKPTDIVGLKPGTYVIEAREVQLTNARYAANPGTQSVQVSASPTPAAVNVAYALSTGSLQVNINGLPQGAAASVTITGPANYAKTLTEEAVLDNLTPGAYQVAAQPVVSGSLYTPAPPSQLVDVVAGSQAVVINVFYASAGTSLGVQINGLPGNLAARVTLTGPNGYSKQLTASEVLSGLVAGTYTVVAQPVTATCASYSAAPATQNVVLTAGQGAVATVTYSAGSGANLCIDGAYITQAIQSFDNSVPLVAGRSGLLRVFVRASASNTAQVPVRVRFYNSSGSLLSTSTIPSPGSSVPLNLDEGTIGSTWNLSLPGSSLQPGMRLLVDVDPNNAFTEPNESDNTWPANGTPAVLDIRTVSTLNVTMVPVIQAARGDTGRVTDANKANFTLPMQRMFPVVNVDATVRTPYTFTGAELQSGGTNWQGLLSELNALRVAEATGRMYYGVVRVGYNSGVAGLGYIGLPTAMGWDYQPSGTEVMAHELGHNFGRLHAPCGNPAGPDGQYPYSGATIGVFGYDIFTGTAKSSSLRDLMSYCDPPWISDYTYRAILNYRAQFYPASASVAQAQVAPAQSSSPRGLLVWGRMESGRLVLEPGIEVDAPASLPTQGGPHRVEGFGPNGETLFSLSFAGEQVADTDDPNDQSFAFVVPMTQLRGLELSRIRLAALGRQAEQRAVGGAAVPSAQRLAPGRVRVSWNPSSARIAMIRDARNGQILSFDRRGSVDVRTTSDDIEVTLSNGVRSSRSRIRPK